MTDAPTLTPSETVDCIHYGQIEAIKRKIHYTELDRYQEIKIISEAIPSELYKSIKEFHSYVVRTQNFCRTTKLDCPDHGIWETVSEQFGKKIQEHIDKLQKMKNMLITRQTTFKNIEDVITSYQHDIQSLRFSQEYFQKEIAKIHTP